MLFSEIYGCYYNAVSRILKKAIDGTLDKKSLNRLVQEEAFGESLITVPDALMSGQWGLLTKDLRPTVSKAPSMPLTTLEKRWMKAILLDSRIQLFQPDLTGLEEVQPLFRPEWIVYYDRYTDGDPYSDQQYIQNFRCVLEALKQGRQLEITFSDRKGNSHHTAVSPRYLEYSEKDDRFRLVCEGYRSLTINLSKLEQCSILTEKSCFSAALDENKTALTLQLKDERNTLERFLLHFSHLEKETKRLDDKYYRITLYYDRQDETEMLIRILSYGSMLKVLSPLDFQEKLRQRIARQIQLLENTYTE